MSKKNYGPQRKFLLENNKNIQGSMEKNFQEGCVFCEIVQGIKPCHKIWEDENFIAFLSIFPNTEGFSIVAFKSHLPSYCFDLPDTLLSQLTVAAKSVAKLIDAKYEDVARCGLILEGYGVDHAHAKIFPMHGTKHLSKWKPVVSHVDKFFHKYEGYISSHDYVRADDKELEKIARKIRS